MSSVLYFIDTLEVGGAEKSLLEITSRFKKYKPIFIQLFPGDGLLPKFKEAGIEVVQLNLKPSNKFKCIALKVQEAISQKDVSLIHSTLFRADQVSRIVASNLNIPLINSLVNNSYAKVRYNSMSLMQKSKLKFIEWIDRRSAKYVDLFISNSNAIKRTNVKALNLKQTKVKVIFRGRQLESFDTDFNTSLLKNELEIKEQKVFLNVSRLLKRKGQLDLIIAFAQLINSGKEALLIIVGEGVYRHTLEEKIKDLNLANYVKLLGNRSDIPQLLNLADFFVFPSYYEGLPGALIEAMISQTPIIASDIPENLECISDKSAIIFEKGDSNSLNQAMQEALEYTKWKKKVDRAYQKAKTSFDVNKIAQQYELTYDELLTW